jgi:hypothetical protein
MFMALGVEGKCNESVPFMFMHERGDGKGSQAFTDFSKIHYS